MSDKLELLLNRTKGSRPPVEPVAIEENGLEEDSCRAYGYLRGLHDRALMIEFRFANGNRQAFPYSWLGPVIFNPSAGLLLRFAGDNITLVLLEGSNMNALVGGAVNLYDRGILRNRITWVREMSRQEAGKAGPGEVIIDRIRIVSHRSDEEPKEAEWLEGFQ